MSITQAMIGYQARSKVCATKLLRNCFANTYSSELWDLVWPFSIGGCHMHRPIKDILLESGNWEIIELTDDEEPWSLFPRVWGRLRKVNIP